MKKRLVALVAVLMLLSILLPCTAVAATDASSRITVYSQYRKSSGKYYYSYENGFGLRDGTIVSSSSVSGLSGQKDCLAQGGCCLFSYAHAIQWVQGYKASDQLLKDLLQYCVAPSNNHGHNYSVCKNHASSFVAYNQYARDHGMTVYRLDSDSYSEGGISKSAAEMCTLLCDGYALIIHIPGHYICAVDYVICDANGNVIQDDGTIPSNCSAYFQIVDSSSSSSTKSGRTFYGKTYKLVTNSDGSQTLVKRDAYSFGTGNSYWVKVSSLSVSAAIKGSWSGHQVADKIGGYSLAGEIQVVVTTRTDKGISEYKLQDEPYAAANTVRKVAPGTDLTVTGVYKNKYGNYWLRFSDGTFLCANDVVLKTQVSAPTASGLVYPKGNLPYGDGFNLRGTITSKSTMLEVWAAVYKLGDNSFTPVTAYLTNVKTVDIVNSALNVGSKGGIRFGNLAVGNYHFTLWGKYYTYANAEKTSDNPLRQTQFVLLVDEPFSVVKDTPVSQITISNVPSEPLLVDEYWYLKATVAPTTATNKTVKWSSSNPSVISVDQEGRLEGLAEGSATITAAATDGSGVKASVTISCIEIITAESLTVNTNYVALEVGESERITATITPANAAYGPEWWSANESIATVSQDGVITAVSPGSTEIRVEVESWHAEPGFLFETIWVDVTAPCQHPNKTTIEGAYYNLRDYRYADNDGHYYQFSYDWYEWCPDCQEMIGDITTGGGSAYEAHSYANNVCTLCGYFNCPHANTQIVEGAEYGQCDYEYADENGHDYRFSYDWYVWCPDCQQMIGDITTGGGIAYEGHTYTAEGICAQCGAVENPIILVERIEVLNQVDVLMYGEPYDFQWRVYPSNATDPTVTWSSSNTDVIRVSDASGVPGVDENVYADVFYRGYGTTTITVRANDASGVSVSFDVTVLNPCQHENAGWVTTKAPTCTEEGADSLICPSCGEVASIVTSATGHTAGDWIVITEATATATGLKRQSCTVCGEILHEQVIPIVTAPPVSYKEITLQPGESFTIIVTLTEVDGSEAARVSIDAGTAPVTFVEAASVSENGNTVTAPPNLSGRFSIMNANGVVAGKIGTVTLQLSKDAEVGRTHYITLNGSLAATVVSGSLQIEVGKARVPGDANEDGVADIFDALLVLKFDSGWDVSLNQSNADVNADGVADIFDALLLLKYDSGWDVELK